jgi:hypothetical protein
MPNRSPDPWNALARPALFHGFADILRRVPVTGSTPIPALSKATAVRSEDNATDGFRTHKGDARKSVAELDHCSVCERVDILALRNDTGLRQRRGGRQTVDRPRVDEEFGFVRGCGLPRSDAATVARVTPMLYSDRWKDTPELSCAGGSLLDIRPAHRRPLGYTGLPRNITISAPLDWA